MGIRMSRSSRFGRATIELGRIKRRLFARRQLQVRLSRRCDGADLEIGDPRGAPAPASALLYDIEVSSAAK
jgi:hypothetical protein